MSISIPLKKTHKKKKVNEIPPEIAENVSAYDIILGKVEIDTDMIPYYK